MVIELRERGTGTLRSEVVGPLEGPLDPSTVEEQFHIGCHKIVVADRERENVWPE